jgi:hypothetical protein
MSIASVTLVLAGLGAFGTTPSVSGKVMLFGMIVSGSVIFGVITLVGGGFRCTHTRFWRSRRRADLGSCLQRHAVGRAGVRE